MKVIVFPNGTEVKEEILEKASEDALRAIEKELPEEALSYEVYKYVLVKCKDKLKEKKITL